LSPERVDEGWLALLFSRLNDVQPIKPVYALPRVEHKVSDWHLREIPSPDFMCGCSNEQASSARQANLTFLYVGQWRTRFQWIFLAMKAMVGHVASGTGSGGGACALAAPTGAGTSAATASSITIRWGLPQRRSRLRRTPAPGARTNLVAPRTPTDRTRTSGCGTSL
jgi:hypothetical protein